MKKVKFLTLLLAVSSLSLAGCSFFDYLTPSTPVTISGDGSATKQTLLYHQKDLSNNHVEDVDSMPTVGNPKLLVIPIWFTDSENYISTGSSLFDTKPKKSKVLEDIGKMAFGSTTDTGWHSISSFYKEESFDLCNITGMVADWYNCGRSYTSFTKNSEVISVVNSAVDSWKSSHPDLVSEYDTDNNGYLDGVICVYAGPNYKNASVQHSIMWAYTSWTNNGKNISSPNVKAFIWASYDFMYVETSSYLDAHTYIHEMGHVMGLNDYYDYNEQGIWSGGFSMQDYNVGGHDPYSMMAFGWANPYVPTESSTVTIRPFVTTGDVVMITPEYNGSPFDEYILLELYSPTGVNYLDSRYQYLNAYPKGPTTVGVRVWHVDSRLLKKNYGVIGSQSYTLTSSIVEGNNYLIGPSNTTYVSGKEDNDHASISSSLYDFKQLELIRRGDYSHSRTNPEQSTSYLSSSDLFRTGDTFSLSDYSSYFTKKGLGNKPLLNNGKQLDWIIRFDAVNSAGAQISITVK